MQMVSTGRLIWLQLAASSNTLRWTLHRVDHDFEEDTGTPSRSPVAWPALARAHCRLLQKFTSARFLQLDFAGSTASIEEMAQVIANAIEGSSRAFRNAAARRTTPRTHPALLVVRWPASLRWRGGLTPPSALLCRCAFLATFATA